MFTQHAYRRTPSYRAASRARSNEYVNRPEVKEARRVKRHEAAKDEAKCRHLHWHAVKARAKRRGVLFTITSAEFSAAWPANGCCRYCDRPLVRNTRHAPSVDQRIPAHGYTVENVDIICAHCNAHKNDHPVEWFERVAHRMRGVVQ